MFDTKIPESLEKMRQYFKNGETRSYTFRINQLINLKRTIIRNEKAIYEALYADFGKSEMESYISEYSFVIDEIDYAIRKLKKWMKPEKVSTALLHFPGKSRIVSEPYGIALIIAPWNYPFMLALTPLIGAIAAGNCSLLKPSSVSKNTSALLAKMIEEAFEPAFMDVIQVSGEKSDILLAQKFDVIFYTGSPAVGETVMKAASRYLTPVVLELGGKSPCVADEDVNIGMTARAIVWGKFFNGGQTCIGVDYLLVNRKIKDKLLDEMIKTLKKFYGENAIESKDIARIINRKQYERLIPFLKDGKILAGGKLNPEGLKIEPAIIDLDTACYPVMQEEIFGPILPVITYDSIEQAAEFINSRSKPLALYLFSRNEKVKNYIMNNTSSGGLCINDTLVHIASKTLPFGGVGTSGMGRYHGKESFNVFSHKKSVMNKKFFFDIFLRYPPYKKPGRFLKWLMKISNGW